MARIPHEELKATEAGADAGGDALYQLGLMYSTGKGVDVDLVTAHKWFNLAAVRGSEEARDWRADLAREMTPAEIAEAQRQAREWLSAR